MPLDLTMRILVADDFGTMRRIIKNILSQIGFENFTEANDGKAALQELRRQPHGLAVTDWNMPNMSGLDLLRAIRGDVDLKNLPVVIITAESQKENIVEAAQAGVTGFIIKPFTVETMYEKIRKIFP